MVTSVPLADVRRKFEHPHCDRVFHHVEDGAALNECRAALAPFAAEAERRPWVTNLSDQSGLDSSNIGGSGLTNGDLRRALASYRVGFPWNMPVRFVYETRAGDQVVRLEAPTHEGLVKLIETASNPQR